ncbi:hypothetical protein IIU_06939 [Bacillus cereus VD133]|uniref:Uncharacterized protein n=1 Tax=Bacillus cereus VD133 TaxID=1053233 RepID=A0A9W5PJA0_BACCE|nr:alpha-xenorhabdolysin family binary toxin subunit A [Bacillus cereus]EOO23735.1 hypothetical protein IIU_06939 [Bacillus cereus VD133]
MTKIAKKYDISPRDLGGKKESPFLLQKKDWVIIQKYTGDGMVLPTNEKEMRKTLELKDSIKLPDFKELYAAYQPIQSHCQNWVNDTYKQVIQTADGIVTYARKAKVFYKPLDEAIQNIQNAESQEGVDKYVKRFNEICVKLAQDVAKYRDDAKTLAEKIQQFSRDTESDFRNLKPVYDSYVKQYGEHSEEIKQLTTDIENLRKELEKETEDYNTYESDSWLSLLLGPIFGFILKAILDDTRGKELQAKIDATKKKIQQETDELQRDIALVALLKKSNSGIEKIMTDMNNALPIIQKIQGIWDALHNDLSALSQAVKEDIQDDPDLADIGEESVLEQWGNVGDEANDFRVNADVEFLS